MKRSLFTQSLKRGALAVPACALMLGAAQAGTTIGLNFQSWYYDSGANPQTIGFGAGYQTTGFPVTAKAFGVAPANWTNTIPLDSSSPTVGYSVALGAATVTLNTLNFWQSDIGNLVNPLDEWSFPASVLPGNDEVTWSFEDNTGWTNSITGLNAAFPNGYVIQLIGATKCTPNSRVVLTDGSSFTNSLGFNPIYTAGNANFSGPVGLLTFPQLTSDAITFYGIGRSINSAQSCAIAGFIISDQPVITRSAPNTTANQGATLSLNATVIGVGSLSYQWRHEGTNVPGATSVPLSKTATPEDAGSWTLVATNLYGATTSDVAVVTINQVPLITTDLAAVTNTVYSGTPVTLSVVAGGAAPLSYQWFRNGVSLAAATNASLVVSNLSVGLSGYSVTVSNLYSPPIAKSATNYLNVLAAPDSYSAAVAAAAPYSYWPFGETAGTTAFDYSGLGHDGQISNTMVLGAAGPQAPVFPGFSATTKAYQFDGVSSFVDCGTTASLSGTNGMSIEAWIKTASPTTQLIAQQRDVAGFNGEYQFIVNSDGTLRFYLFNGGNQGPVTTSAKVADGAWHHVVATRNGNSLAIYIDGSLAGSATSAAVSLVRTLRTYIGADERDHGSYFNGSMANVAIYDYALSTAQVISHYITASGAPFVMKLTPGGMIADTKPVGVLHPGQGFSVGWSNSVTDLAAVTRSGVGAFATASGSQVSIPADADFNSSTGTFMFWMQASAPLPGPGTEGAMLVDRRTTNGTVVVLHDDGSIFVQCLGGVNSFSGGYLPDGNWHHVAVTYDQSATGSMEIFVDGASVGSQLNTTNWAWPTTAPIEIGKSHDSYWRRFDGNLDDFRFYNRILTPSEIASVAASNALVDNAALKVRYNFDTATGVGQTVSWTFGSLYSSPTLGPSAVWTPVSGAISPYSFMPGGSALFFRAAY